MILHGENHTEISARRNHRSVPGRSGKLYPHRPAPTILAAPRPGGRPGGARAPPPPGGGMRSVAPPVLAASVITCAAVLLTGWQGVPWGYRETQRTLAKIVSERAGAGGPGHGFRAI